jgi:SAM-dependent methyltransferase
MARLIARANANATIVGIDVRQQYIDFARAKAATDGLQNVQFRQGDVFSLPFADGTFDVVWTKYLLQWLNEPKKALADFKRVARPGGVVVSCDFDGYLVEHFPIDPDFEAMLRNVMASLVDTHVGRKVAPYMIELGMHRVKVEIEMDRICTVVGAVDPERRRNWEVQWSAALPHIVSSSNRRPRREHLSIDSLHITMTRKRLRLPP